MPVEDPPRSFRVIEQIRGSIDSFLDRLGAPGRLPDWRVRGNLTDESFDALLREGLRRAASRCRRDGPSSVQYQFLQASDTVRRLLGDDEVRRTISSWHKRGIVLFVELIGVAVYARLLNQEALLSRTDIQVFADWLKRILNDWIQP